LYKKVLLAYDGSVEGRLALREGAKLAQFCGAEVFLLAVVEPSFGATLEGGVMVPIDDQIATYKAILDEGVKRLQAIGFSPTARLGMGAAGQEIAGVAEEIGANLVVVGQRPTGPLGSRMANTSAVRVIWPKKPIPPTNSPAGPWAIGSRLPVLRTASAPCNTMNKESEGPPCATSISPRTRSRRTIALKAFCRCSELSVLNSAKSSDTFSHPSVELGPLIGDTRFDCSCNAIASQR
jgi:nucleotide-binding universal stress UspA family protein